MTHTFACACCWCEKVKLNTVDVDLWRDMHYFCGDFHGVFEEQPFDHEAGDWHWLICQCSARVLIGTHPLQRTPKKPRVRRAKTKEVRP